MDWRYRGNMLMLPWPADTTALYLASLLSSNKLSVSERCMLLSAHNIHSLEPFDNTFRAA